MKRVTMALGLVAWTVACIPALGPGDSLVTSTRVLAVRADPAEAAPGTKVTFTAFVAGLGGTVGDADIAWNFCSAPKPLTEDNVVSNACLGSSALVVVGEGPTATAAIPANACALFGPDTASMGLRPRDPDITGGYSQPLRADLVGSDGTFELARIHCDLANADADAASVFAKAYKLNQNPHARPAHGDTRGCVHRADGNSDRRTRDFRGELGRRIGRDVCVLRCGLADRDEPTRIDAGGLVRQRRNSRHRVDRARVGGHGDIDGQRVDGPEPRRHGAPMGRASRQPRGRRFRGVRPGCAVMRRDPRIV